jgi:pimeloyl-ACP methyl ester carboxylesterase
MANSNAASQPYPALECSSSGLVGNILNKSLKPVKFGLKVSNGRAVPDKRQHNMPAVLFLRKTKTILLTMKKLLIAFISCCLCTVAYTQTRTIAGDWEGNFAGQIRLVFHFVPQADGTVSGTFDSPDQGATGLPFSEVRLTKDSIHVHLLTPKAAYIGRFVNDTTLVGAWLQGAATMPLAIKKGSSYTKPKRPQTPVPPYTYNSEEVEYDNAGKTVHFGATYTYPKTGGPFATAILITGSGTEDRDETLFGHKPFAVIADHLAKNGYAVLRIDDRGAGKTKGPVDGVTTADFATDVEAAIAYLKTRKESNSRKTGLIGHSEGGLIALMVAAAHPEDIDFIIGLAGPGETGAALMADQNEAIWLKYGVTPAAAAAYRSLYYQVVAPITVQSDSAGIYKNAWQAYLNWKKTQPPVVLEQLGLVDNTQSSLLLQRLSAGLSMPWIKYLMASDPAPYIKQLKCKYLALNGSEDIQVVAKTNLPAIQQSIDKSSIKVYSIQELKGLNHLFQHCKTCTVQEYGQLEETFAPEALDTMTHWLNEHVK